VGIIVPRHGQSAVNRNRLKRRLREIVRQDVLPTERGLDIIIRTAPGAYSVPFADLRVEMNGVLGRLMS
jgi:ribonuclease P protein component